VLILSDGSKSLIPTAWTDFETAIERPQNPQLTGSFEDLLRLRTLIDTVNKCSGPSVVHIYSCRSGHVCSMKIGRMRFAIGIQASGHKPKRYPLEKAA
jgi:hypothetical protein